MATPRARLELADWRRRIAELYAEVRSLTGADPEAAWRRWRDERERLFTGHPESPVPASSRAGFRASHWPYDARWRFEVEVEPPRSASSEAGALDLGSFAGARLPVPVSTGGEMHVADAGRVTVPFEAGGRSLTVFWLDDYAGGLLLPFGDATNGAETYGSGRYLLDTAKGADLGGDPDRGTLVLDFNFAFQPSCAFDPRWACPLAPPSNRLDIAVEAGERLAAS